MRRLSLMRFPRRARMILLTGLLLPSVLQPAGPSGAGRGVNDIDKEIKAVREAAEESSKAESKALLSYADALSRLQKANALMSAAQSDLAAAQTDLDNATVEYNRLAAEYDSVERRLEDNARQSNEKSESFDALIRSLYARQSHPVVHNPAALTSSSQDLIDAASATQYYRIVSAAEQGEIDQLSQLHDEQVALRDELSKQRAAADEARAAKEEKRNAVAEVETRVEAARDAVATEEASKKTLLATIQAQQSEYEARIDELEKESQKLKEELRKSQSTGPMKGNGKFKYPVNASITSYFGPRIHPIYGTSRMHTGLDLGAGCSTPIRAAGPGTVIKASYYGGYGNAVIIDHGGGFATLYGHQSKIAVSVGDELAQGDVLGYVGSTGASTGCHLHFEVRINGDPVNPLAYL